MDSPEPSPKLRIEPLDTTRTFRHLAYGTLKKAITEMDIYSHPEEIRLDERRLSQELAISRTPVREAITLLEQEGFVRSSPRRGIFVVRKTKAEILEMIAVWAALESMSARLAVTRASDDDAEAGCRSCSPTSSMPSRKSICRNIRKRTLPSIRRSSSSAATSSSPT